MLHFSDGMSYRAMTYHTQASTKYLPQDLFELIRDVQNEGLLNVEKMKSGQWYKVLVENKITMEVADDGRRRLKPCRTELNNPDVNWGYVWELASQPGLDSTETSFLWRMLHNLLPTPARLFHMQIRNTTSPNCQLCDQSLRGDLFHCLLTGSFNSEVSSWLLNKIRGYVPELQDEWFS